MIPKSAATLAKVLSGYGDLVNCQLLVLFGHFWPCYDGLLSFSFSFCFVFWGARSFFLAQGYDTAAFGKWHNTPVNDLFKSGCDRPIRNVRWYFWIEKSNQTEQKCVCVCLVYCAGVSLFVCLFCFVLFVF